MNFKIVITCFLAAISANSSGFAATSVKGCDGKDWASLSALIDREISTPFEEKFKSVSGNIHTTSEKNFQNLTASFLKYRAEGIDLDQAKLLLLQTERNMTLTHSTSEKAALAILKSGSILSKDELIRRGIIDKSSMSAGNTNGLYDGQIGERDVIYLAYREIPKDGRYMFGDFTFVFDLPQTMSKAYFTLNSFSAGSPVSYATTETGPDGSIFYSSDSAGCDIDAFNYMRKSYGDVLFEGSRYRDLLYLSAVQWLWTQQHSAPPTLSKKAKSAINDYNAATIAEANALKSKQINKFVEPSFPKETDRFICEEIERIGQSNSCDFLVNTKLNRYGALSHFSEMPGDYQGFKTLVSEYQNFPSYGVGDRPLVFRSAHDFWEVKVPRSLSLATLKSIIVPGKSDSNGASAQDQAEIENAIKQFSEKTGWAYKVQILGTGQYEFVFIK